LIQRGVLSLHFIYRTVAICFLIFILFISLIGIFSTPETTITFASVIESPRAIVWQYLTNTDRIVQWRKDIRNLDILNMKEMGNGALLKFVQNKIEYHEQVIEWLPEKKVILQRIDDLNYPLLHNVLTSIEIKGLIDGSTEINIVIKYNVRTFFSKIYNKIYLRNYFIEQYENQLLVLKKVLEKV
jgi:hypothetical protein